MNYSNQKDNPARQALTRAVDRAIANGSPVVVNVAAQTWRNKAQRLIGEMCLTSYRQANTKADGTLYKRHHTYSVPAMAQDLIECLNNEDEHRAKSIFMALHVSPELARD